MLPVELRRSLGATGVVMAEARDPWWVIASAAAALHGAAPIRVEDVDVLLGEGDAHRLLPGIGLAAAPGVADVRFRSDVFATWTVPPLAVEFMANLHLRDGAAWRRGEPRTRQEVVVDDVPVFVPALSELQAMLRRFGRPKDLERVRLLDQVRSDRT